ncbi:MAG TPA: leucine-rich repeat protein, partial [Candidatus Saccharibacteria bacterium]|nr:leucine-rich repeat protein [Candidatus Saccharibacteria bacterium]
TLIVSLFITILAAVFFTVYFATSTTLTKAAPVPESCFVFNSGTGMITGYNPDTDALCVSDIDIPQTIGGVTVTGIAEFSFDDDIVTSVAFPETITLIESQAFTGDDITFASLNIDVTGNLVIEPFAFKDVTGGTITISADGDLSDGGNFNDSVLASMTLQAGGDITIDGASTGSATIGSLSILAAGSIIIKNGSFNVNEYDSIAITALGGGVTTEGGVFGNATANSLAISANGNAYINASFNNTTFDSASIDTANGDITIINGSFGLSNMETVEMLSGGDITFTNGAFHTNQGLKTLSLEAADSMNIINNTVSNMPTLTTASLATGTGLLTISGGAFGNNHSLETINLDAPAGLSINGGSMNSLSALKNLNILANTGDVSITDGALLSYDLLTSVEIITSGSITMGRGVLMTNNVLESIKLEAGSNLTINAGVANDLPELKFLSLSAGNAATLNGNSFMNLQALEELLIDAGNSLVIGDSAFNAISVEQIILPASLTSIGEKAFYGSNLKAVYLGSAPTLGNYAFGLAGATYNDGSFSYSGLDNVRFVPVYISVPHSYSDTVYAPDDVNGDSIDDHTGGYIINPAQIT